MGIIKVILISCLFIIKLSAAETNIIADTVDIDNKRYIKHIVKVGESLNKIAIIHNVTVSDILSSNEMSRKLYYNQILFIPVNKNNVKQNNLNYNSIKSSEEIHLALLMPYYLVKNDTMFNGFEDTSKISSIYYNSSEPALSFHLGVKLALDSLRKNGKNIVLYTFDTNKDTNKVYNIVASGALDNMDVIIGPLYAKNFDILCQRYGNDKSKTLINPLSKLTESVKSYRSVYQIQPDITDQLEIIKNRILYKYKNKRVMLLFQEEEKGIALYAQNLFRKEKRNINIYNIESSHVDSLRNIFSDYQIVIIPSNNRSFVSSVLGSIGIMDSTSIVFGLDTWKRYDNLDIDNLMELDVHIPMSGVFNPNNKHDKSFLSLFEKVYNTNQGKYTHIAYNIIMHFCSNYNAFQFKRLNNGGKINVKAPLHHYIDYEIIKAN